MWEEGAREAEEEREEDIMRGLECFFVEEQEEREELRTCPGEAGVVSVDMCDERSCSLEAATTKIDELLDFE